MGRKAGGDRGIVIGAHGAPYVMPTLRDAAIRMSLKTDIENLTREFEAHVPEHLRTILLDELERLKASGVAGRCLRGGDRAPSFSLPNPIGRMVSSSALLAKGPLVLCFYRGIW